MRRILIATAALAAGTGLSFAQDATTTSAVAGYLEVENDAVIVAPFDISVDDLEDMDVFGADGEEIGEIDEVLMTQDGRIVAISVEVGGFLGMGETEMVFPLDQLSLQDGRLLTALTREQVEALEEWPD